MASDAPRSERLSSYGHGRPSDGDRLAEIMEVILAIAANDFTRRASVGAGDDVLDGIAAGLNMLAEEEGRREKADAEVRARLLQNERLAAIGMLAAGVAHEVNNPAAFLLGNFTALAEHVAALRGRVAPEHEPVLEEIAEIARVGKGGVERIATIVRGLRNFARIEEGAISVLRLDEIAEQACILTAREIVHRARLVKKLAPIGEVRGDRTKLTQVLTNLLMNAAQAIDEGDPTANEVELATEETADRVIVRVRDTGRGIPIGVQPRIFEPFFTTKEYGVGTGLGLSISADIARQHGGTLRFESMPGRGTTFELVLPKESGLMTVAAPAPAPIGVAPASPRRLRVLIIDDEEQLLRMYRRMLKDHDVTTAIGGQAGIEVVGRDAAWDVIICDLVMPEVDGPAVWEWLEANASALCARTLFCSGGAFTGRGARFAEAHRDRFLDKPIHRADLTAAIERLASTRTGGAGPGR